MKTISAKWLRLVLLPLLAIALFVIHDQVQTAAINVGEVFEYREFALAGVLLGTLAGPIITSLLFAFPIAQIYARFSIGAAVLIVAPTVFHAFFYLLNISPYWTIVNAGQTVSLVVLTPLVAHLAHRALADSRLTIIALNPDSVDSVVGCFAGDSENLSKRPSRETTNHLGNDSLRIRPIRWLQLSLLPVVGIAIFVVHGFVQAMVGDIAVIPHESGLLYFGMLSGALIGPSITALLFAYPIARLYERQAALVGALASAPTIGYWITVYLETRIPFLILVYCIELISLAVLIPWTASMAFRKLRCSRLVALVH